MQSNDLNEQHRYPDPGRPILRYERTFRQAGLYTHWHEELELLLVHEGTARFRINQRQVPVGPGQLLYVNRRVLHGFAPPQGVPVRFTALVLRPEAVRHPEDSLTAEPLQDLWQDASTPYLLLEAGHPAQADFQALLQPPRQPLLLRSSLLALFAHLMERQPTPMEAAPVRLDGMRRVLDLLLERYDEPWSLEQLAGVAGLSKGYFCSCFKQVTGMTAVSYLNERRIQQAAWLLRTTTQPILAVAQACGFDNASYFIRVFRRALGMTPSQYRANGRCHG